MNLEAVETYFLDKELNHKDIDFLLLLLKTNNSNFFNLYEKDTQKKSNFYKKIFACLSGTKNSEYQKLLKDIWGCENGKYRKALYSFIDYTSFGQQLIKSSKNPELLYKRIEDTSDIKGLENLLLEFPDFKEKIPNLYHNNDIDFYYACTNLGIKFDKKVSQIDFVSHHNVLFFPDLLFKFLKTHEENIPDNKWNIYINGFINIAYDSISYNTFVEHKNKKNYQKDKDRKYIVDNMFLMRELRNKEKIDFNSLVIDNYFNYVISPDSERIKNDDIEEYLERTKKQEKVFLYKDVKTYVENNDIESTKKLFSSILLDFHIKQLFWNYNLTLETVDLFSEDNKLEFIDKTWDKCFAMKKTPGYGRSPQTILNRLETKAQRLELLSVFFHEEKVQNYLLQKALTNKKYDLLKDALLFFSVLENIKSDGKMSIHSKIYADDFKIIYKRVAGLIESFPEAKKELLSYAYMSEEDLSQAQLALLTDKLQINLENKTAKSNFKI